MMILTEHVQLLVVIVDLLVRATARTWSGLQSTVANRSGMTQYSVRCVCRADDGVCFRN